MEFVAQELNDIARYFESMSWDYLQRSGKAKLKAKESQHLLIRAQVWREAAEFLRKTRIVAKPEELDSSLKSEL